MDFQLNIPKPSNKGNQVLWDKAARAKELNQPLLPTEDNRVLICVVRDIRYDRAAAVLDRRGLEFWAWRGRSRRWFTVDKAWALQRRLEYRRDARS